MGSGGYSELSKYAVARLYTGTHRSGHREAHDVSIDVPLFCQGKMLPLSLLGSCVLELELGGYDDCFTTGTNITNTWEIVRPVVFADVISVDPSLTNSFAHHLLNGKQLPITFDGFF